jgi:hypothetical protein
MACCPRGIFNDDAAENTKEAALIWYYFKEARACIHCHGPLGKEFLNRALNKSRRDHPETLIRQLPVRCPQCQTIDIIEIYDQPNAYRRAFCPICRQNLTITVPTLEKKEQEEKTVICRVHSHNPIPLFLPPGTLPADGTETECRCCKKPFIVKTQSFLK